MKHKKSNHTQGRRMTFVLASAGGIVALLAGIMFAQEGCNPRDPQETKAKQEDMQEATQPGEKQQVQQAHGTPAEQGQADQKEQQGGAETEDLAAIKILEGASTIQRHMEAFYRNLWERHLAPLEALNQAQAEVRNDPRFAAPIHWAGWVLAGEGW